MFAQKNSYGCFILLTSTSIDQLSLQAKLKTPRLLVGDVCVCEKLCKNGTVAGNVVYTIAIRSWHSLTECSTHHYIGHCVHGHLEALEITRRVGLVVYEHVHASVPC
jgi:hypothetical protein